MLRLSCSLDLDLLLLLLLSLLPGSIRERFVGHVHFVLPLLVHGEGVSRLGDLATDVANVSCGLHVVGLHVPQHRRSPGALLSAQVARVDPVRVGQQSQHQLVQIGHAWNNEENETSVRTAESLPSRTHKHKEGIQFKSRIKLLFRSLDS